MAECCRRLLEPGHRPRIPRSAGVLLRGLLALGYRLMVEAAGRVAH